MALTVGSISNYNFVSSDVSPDSIEIVNFKISPHSLSTLEMMDSAFSSPSRYFIEMIMRLQKNEGKQGIFVFNPRFNFPGKVMQFFFDSILSAPIEEEFLVFTGFYSTTLAIFLKVPIPIESKAKLFALSGIDPQLDLEVLETVLGKKGRIVQFPFLLQGNTEANGFLSSETDWESERLRSRLSLAAIQKKPERPEHVAVCPFHAGDVLFLCQALRSMPVVSRILVLEEYKNIVQEALPDVQVIGVKAPNPNRRNFGMNREHSYVRLFMHAAQAQLGSQWAEVEGIFHFLRPYRNYNATSFHLREAFSFALGNSFLEPKNETWIAPRILQPKASQQVVLHFDGGWKLKSYPKENRQFLINSLKTVGFDPLVLGDPDPTLSGCRFQKFTGLESYKELLKQSVGMIGVDSFPSHYAIDAGVPTIQIFGSTHPRNSNHPDSQFNRTLHHPLPCVPCLSSVHCRLDSGLVCRAMPAPQEISEAFAQMIRALKSA